jgi:hypothetical protein
MSKRNQTQRTNVESNDAHIDTQHDANALNVELNDETTSSQSLIDMINDQNDMSHVFDARVKTNANYVTLKHIIETRKIKCDAKLIRRVLRKYYATKINHQHRDAWTFAHDQIDDVVNLINTHCRANMSTNDKS